MLYFNNVHIPLGKLRRKERVRICYIDDFYCMDEYFVNDLKVKWEKEDNIDQIDVILQCDDTSKTKKTYSLMDGNSIIHRLPSKYVGLIEVEFIINNEKYCHFIEIKPKKINKDQFDQLKNDLRSRSLSIYRRLSPAKTFINTNKFEPFSDIHERFISIRNDMDTLIRIVERISQNPKKRLISSRNDELFIHACDIDEGTIHGMCSFESNLVEFKQVRSNTNVMTLKCPQTGRPFIPETVNISSSTVSYDVFENRLLKRFLRLISLNMNTLKREFECASSLHDREAIMLECDELIKNSRRLLRTPFLENVSEINELLKSSLALRQDVQYMRFYSIFKRFISRPYFDRSTIYDLGIAELCQLYEYWCLLIVFDVLLSWTEIDWTITHHDIFDSDELGYGLRIKRNEPILRLQREDQTIELFFQCKIHTFLHRKPKSKTGPKEPDIVVKLYKNDRFSNMVILDAKYRSDIYQKDEVNSARSAINDMFVYRDAFRTNKGKRLCGWAIILYPGEKPDGSASQYTNLFWDDGSVNENEIATSGIMPFCLRPSNDLDSQIKDLNQYLETYLFSRDIQEENVQVYFDI